MEPVVQLIANSGYYSIYNFTCECLSCSVSKREYTNQFSICFIRTGNFNYHIFRATLDTFSGYALVNKPGYEYRVAHPSGLPDECTVIRFTDEFYERLIRDEQLGNNQFFQNPDRQSVLVKMPPPTEYLHQLLLHKIHSSHTTVLETDTLVMELLENTLCEISEESSPLVIAERMKKHHLKNVENAKQYINTHFAGEITLDGLAAYCCISPFHFSRIFRQFTGISPHQYLLEIRLKNAELLLRTNLPVTDAAFLSGFNSLEHFSVTFRKRFGTPPSLYQRVSIIQQDF